MPFGVKPECIQCQRTESAMWRSTELGHICNECSQKHLEEEKQQQALTQQKEEASAAKNLNAETSSTPKIILRKSTRMTRNYKTRLNPYALPKPVAPKGKGRRNLFKKTPVKSPSTAAQTVTVQSVLHDGAYIQVGDIMELQDVDGDIYYAQIRGLICDAYGEKSGVITWLLPTTNDRDGFDPSKFIIGPDEDLPRRLDCMTFVMHAPSDYFKSRHSPYPTMNHPSDRYKGGFIWARLDHKPPLTCQ